MTNWRQEKQYNTERVDMNKRQAKKIQRKNKKFMRQYTDNYRDFKKYERYYHERGVEFKRKAKRKQQKIDRVRKITGFSENVVGCYLSNYKVPHICPIATNGWCRDYTKCQVIEQMLQK